MIPVIQFELKRDLIKSLIHDLWFSKLFGSG